MASALTARAQTLPDLLNELGRLLVRYPAEASIEYLLAPHCPDMSALFGAILRARADVSFISSPQAEILFQSLATPVGAAQFLRDLGQNGATTDRRRIVISFPFAQVSNDNLNVKVDVLRRKLLVSLLDLCVIRRLNSWRVLTVRPGASGWEGRIEYGQQTKCVSGKDAVAELRFILTEVALSIMNLIGEGNMDRQAFAGDVHAVDRSRKYAADVCESLLSIVQSRLDCRDYAREFDGAFAELERGRALGCSLDMSGRDLIDNPGTARIDCR